MKKNGKVAFVFDGNIEFCPYLKKYIKLCNLCNLKYDVIFWQREILSQTYPDNYSYYQRKSKLNKSKVLKAVDFVLYKKWLEKTVISEQYDKIILLDTKSGILLSKILLSKFKNRYIYDIRDYSFEKYRIYRILEKRIIENSFFTSISSAGFKKFLPEYNYILVHNMDLDEALCTKAIFKKKTPDQILNLVWIGAVRYFEHHVKVIKKLENDKRFCLYYHGSGPDSEKLKEYCNKNNYNNVIFTGHYNNTQKPELLRNADILLNAYDVNEGEAVKYLTSNKYYDGMIYRIPQWVECNTFKAKLIQKTKVGIALDIEDYNFSDKLYNYYHSIDENKFEKRCLKTVCKYIEEDELYKEKVMQFLL